MAKRIICSYLLVAGLSARCAAPDGTIPADTSAATVRSLLATLARSPEAKAAYDRIFGPTAAATTGAAVESKALAIAAATVFDPGYVLAVVAEVVAYETGEPRFSPGTTWMLRMKEVLAPAFTEDDSVLLNGLAEIVSLLHLPCPITLGFGPLGTLDAALVRSAVAQITDHGFYVFPRRLAEAEQLAQLLLRHAVDGTDSVWTMPSQTILREPVVQRLLVDPSILSVLQAVLGAGMTLVKAQLMNGVANSEVTQYHQDCNDAVRFVKVWVYLSDVEPDSEAHVFVRTSQRNHSFFHAAKRTQHAEGPDRYEPNVRHPDADVEVAYGKGNIEVIAGPKGTVFFDDTRGFHKAMPYTGGDRRLVLMFHFASSTFPYDPSELTIRLPPEPFNVTTEWLEQTQQCPHLIDPSARTAARRWTANSDSESPAPRFEVLADGETVTLPLGRTLI